MAVVKSVTDLLQDASAAMHGTLEFLRQIETGAHPLEVAALASIDPHIEETGRRKNFGVHWLVFDWLRKFVRGIRAERAIDFTEQLAIEGVKLSVVGGAVVCAEPPAPIAAFRREQSVVRHCSLGFCRPGACSSLLGRGFVKVPRVSQ